MACGGKSGSMVPDDQTARIDSVIEMYRKIQSAKPDSAIMLFEQLFLTYRNDLIKRQVGKIYYQIGTILAAKMELEKSDSILLKAKQIFEDENAPCSLSAVYWFLGTNQRKRGDILTAIALFRIGEKILEKHNDDCDINLNIIYYSLSASYQSIGKMDSARYYVEKTLDYAREKNDKDLIVRSFLNLGAFLGRFGEYEKAKENFYQAILFNKEENNKKYEVDVYTNISLIFRNEKKTDSALLYLEKADSLSTLINYQSVKGVIYQNIASINFDIGDYDKSLTYVNKSLEVRKHLKDSVGIAQSQDAFSAVYIKKGNYKDAKEMAEKALDFALRKNFTELLFTVYTNLSEALIHLGEKEAALDVIDKKDALRDSIFSKEKIDAVQEWQVKYETAQKEAEIQLLQERQSTQQRLSILYVGIIILLIITFAIGIAWVRGYRQRTNMQLEQLKYFIVKSKFIPHFTGNVLNSINYLISKNPDMAQRYIADFSSFTSRSLFHTEKLSRTLEEEIAYVQNYLNLEKLRFGDELNYTVDVSSDEYLKIQIPTMILHTFCENALKHGIRPKNSCGEIKITAFYRADFFVLTVEDDGIGREKAKLLKTSGGGEGLKIVEQQIKLFNKKNKRAAQLKIVDLHSDDNVPSGTRFELHIPAGYKI